MSLVVVFYCLLAKQTLTIAEIYGNWISAIAEYHIQWSATSACEIPWETDPVPLTSFPYYKFAAVSNEILGSDKSGCGRCYELKCISVTDTGTCACKQDTVTIAALDLKGGGDFDLSEPAYDVLTTPYCNGPINVQYRRVSCNYTTGIKVTQISNDAYYWYVYI